jgi:CPA1 family monovalent cation:H+ antiporter
MLTDRIASPATVQTLLGYADALAEGARAEGRVGYRRAAEAALTFSIGFRLAYAIYRRLGIVPPLAHRLAERVELLLVMRFVIERLEAFNRQQIRALFGDRIANVTEEILDQRRDAIVGAVDALRLQYHDYILELEVRFLQQSALRHEVARYQSLFEEGLITREVYDDLQRGAHGAQADKSLPRFDIGLDTQHLVRRLDILAGLDDAQLGRICRQLRPRFAIPNDRIIKKGERGDAVYFIASGAVEVVLPGRRVRLGSGDFFCEMALLSGQPRHADVIALTYCKLLVLHRSDFQQFIRAHPEARATIHRVAEARTAMNREAKPAEAEMTAL